MNIKQASEQSGVSAPNIRFYEKEGLLTPARRQGNDYRDYTAGDIRTLKLIRMLRMLDVPLPTIKAVLRGKQPLQQAGKVSGERWHGKWKFLVYQHCTRRRDADRARVRSRSSGQTRPPYPVTKPAYLVTLSYQTMSAFSPC